jgi:hypothetical protein
VVEIHSRTSVNEGGYVQLVTPRRCAATLIVSTGLALGACGTGNASHVVGLTPATPGTAAGAAGSAPPSQSSVSAPAQPAAAVAPADQRIDATMLSQVDTELGAVDNNLDQSVTDLSVNPQGDS